MPTKTESAAPDLVPQTPQVIEDQIMLNALVATHTNLVLPLICDTLNRAPTMAMCVAVTRTLFDYGILLFQDLIAAMAKDDPEEGRLPASMLRRATGFARAYGSPIVADMTSQLDLRPKVAQMPHAGTRVEPHDNAAWRWQHEAATDLVTISLDLEAVGFEPDLVRDVGPPINWSVDATLLENPTVTVSVRISSIEAEPYVLEVTKCDGTGETPPAHPIRSQSMTKAQLLRVIDAFLAGLRAR